MIKMAKELLFKRLLAVLLTGLLLWPWVNKCPGKKVILKWIILRGTKLKFFQ